MKIFGWAADDAGPGWYRLRVPLEELAKHGHEVTVSTTMPDWVMEEADVVVGQRVCQPGATKRWRQLAAGVFGHRPLLVFEIDDDLWDLEPANVPAWRFYGGRESPMLDNLAECAKLADVCTVSTEPLAEVLRRFNSDVIVLPNQLPDAAFIPNPLARRSESITLGWAGGASHVRDVAEMVDGVRKFLKYFPTSRFVNMGTLFPSIKQAAAGKLVIREWTENVKAHYHRLAELDIGLAPLRPSPFNRSKSEIKFLEYAAAGAATIATRHGPYERVIEDGVTGMLCSQPHEWGRALGYLHDQAERSVIAAEALTYAGTRHIKLHWQSWEQTYEFYL